MNHDYLPIIVFVIFFLFNIISGITLYLGINTFNTTPPDPIALGQLLFLIFAINGPLICVIIYAFYKQKKQVKQ
ncbi:MAG: hypothetical protein LUQ65_05780 [Candidatus Helarchaeota archaeon]|nr:hypothetical protein [Candidatus Helarchaeota archaeon]